MSTHSSIACVREDGTVIASYCHFDGYPGYMVNALNLGHDSYEKALALASVGAIMSTGSHVGDIWDWTDVQRFDDEPEVSPFVYPSLVEYRIHVKHDICGEYHYLFWRGDWYVEVEGIYTLLERAAA